MTVEETDRFASARAVANAVLYEGYVLYPYRASSAKNQMRWQFGVLVPPAFAAVDRSERQRLRTECLVEVGSAAVLSVRLRCLQVQHRTVEAATDAAATDGGEFTPVGSLEVDGQVHVEWDEAVDQIIDLPTLPVPALLAAPHDEPFALAGRTEIELLRSAEGAVAGRVIRECLPVEGRVLVNAGQAEPGGLVQVTVVVENTTEWAGTSARRDAVMGHCLVAVHTMLAVDDGAFVSLLDPPTDAVDAVARCHNDGAFPVLIGAGDVMLSSPIILYDHPEVAPESPGDLYDSTEIDEILALRVLTLTDEEKAEARGTDARAAAIIDRCDDMPPEMWDRLHGAVRAMGPADTAGNADIAGEQPRVYDQPPVYVTPGGVTPGTGTEGDEMAPWWDPGVDASVDPWSDTVIVAGVEVGKGTAVRLRPSHRSDAQDIFLQDMAATVAGVFKDVDGSEQVAVTLDDDPASQEFQWQGRYLFFHPDEVQPVTSREAAS